MSDSPDAARREHPSTYFVQDRSNLEELERVRLQDQMITKAMGGVLPEQAEPERFRRVLDVGCGTGGWLMEAARTYPTMVELVGVDISGKMVRYAREQAEAAGVADRVRFEVMDALRMLEFPASSFDLVNIRLGTSFLRKWDWPKLLQECQRVCTRGGVIRITESEMVAEGNSPALTQLSNIGLDAAYQAGNLFTPESHGVIKHLTDLLSRHGLRDVQTHMYELRYRAGTREGQYYYEDVRRVFRVALPFYRKWTRVPDDYEEIYQQALEEVQRPEFEAIWHLLTVWGQPGK